MGVRLSDGEHLCNVCASAMFIDATELDTSPPPCPPVALFASEGLQEDILECVPAGRQRKLLGELRKGNTLRCCACIPSVHVGGRLGSFVGFCRRRRVAVLKIDDAMACVPLELLRYPDDGAVQHDARMLRTLLRVGTASTLQHGTAAVLRNHTLCGTPELGEAMAALRWLRRKSDAGSGEDGQEQLLLGSGDPSWPSECGSTLLGLAADVPLPLRGLRLCSSSCAISTTTRVEQPTLAVASGSMQSSSNCVHRGSGGRQ
jgi:hypothetical protein